MNDSLFLEFPLIAILRGVLPSEVEAVSQALFDAGFRVIEVPLNSPDALASIARLSASLGNRTLIGAGTVLSVKDVEAVSAAGGRLIVSPNANHAVIQATKRLGMISAPGVVKAWRAVFPKETALVAVGGITSENMRDYLLAGVSGFGLGASLFKPGMSVDTVRENAQRFAAAWRALL
jgi:2-dehydro-3-deoxyphosphogalactonate aldolase